MAIFKKKDKKEKEILLDRRLLSYIQPKGGITYRDEKFISTGDTYICCIHIYEFPKTIGDFWLEKLMNIPNTIAIMDILTEDTVQVKRNRMYVTGSQKIIVRKWMPNSGLTK